MPGRRDHPERKPARLPNWDYTSAGGYYVTICLAHREPRFGTVVDDCMRLNAAGEMVSATWIANAARYPDAELDAYIVMPDHLHGIVFLGTNPTTGPGRSKGLIRFVQSFKSLAANEYGRGVKAGLHPPYDRDFWQGSFYDHIIRDDCDLNRIRAYIEGNPARWTEKHGNPNRNCSSGRSLSPPGGLRDHNVKDGATVRDVCGNRA